MSPAKRGRPRKPEAVKRARREATERSRARQGWTCFAWKVQKPFLAFLRKKAREAGAATVGELLRQRVAAEILADARARALPEVAMSDRDRAEKTANALGMAFVDLTGRHSIIKSEDDGVTP